MFCCNLLCIILHLMTNFWCIKDTRSTTLLPFRGTRFTSTEFLHRRCTTDHYAFSVLLAFTYYVSLTLFALGANKVKDANTFGSTYNASNPCSLCTLFISGCFALLLALHMITEGCALKVQKRRCTGGAQ